VAKLSVLRRDDVAPTARYGAPREATGVAWSAALSPAGYSLWLVESELEDGATLSWRAPHGDDGIFVVQGVLDVGGRLVPADGAVIVESGVETTIAARGRTRILHGGSRDDQAPGGGRFGPPAPAGHDVHVVGPAGRFVSGSWEGVRAVWFADSTCPTCRIALFTVEAPGAKHASAHHHSQDEIIFILSGAISMGRARHGPGTSLCIPAGTRYGFVGDPGGHRFLNLRGDASMQTNDRAAPALPETALERGGSLVDGHG